jgi:hypothetical protein
MIHLPTTTEKKRKKQTIIVKMIRQHLQVRSRPGYLQTECN